MVDINEIKAGRIDNIEKLFATFLVQDISKYFVFLFVKKYQQIIEYQYQVYDEGDVLFKASKDRILVHDRFIRTFFDEVYEPLNSVFYNERRTDFFALDISNELYVADREQVNKEFKNVDDLLNIIYNDTV